MVIGVLISAIAFSLRAADERSDPPPGGIRLLDGYKHESLQGVDTDVGRISKEGGVTIEYDIGPLSLTGNYAKGVPDDELAWFREQTIGGRPVQSAFTRRRELHVTFLNNSTSPKNAANFRARVTSPEEMADVLLMLLTYRTNDQPAGEKDRSTEKEKPRSGNPPNTGGRDSPSDGRFIDGGAIVEDTRTGLLWQKDGDASGLLNFYEASEYAVKLEINGLSGWRVPTKEELASIFPATDPPFTDTKYTKEPCCGGPHKWDSYSYWTSNIDPRQPDYAYVYQWYVDGGANNCIASRNYAYVRCVHDPFKARGSDRSAVKGGQRR